MNSSNLAKIIIAYKGAGKMNALAERINALAGETVVSTSTLYGYTSRPRRPEPKQIGTLARYIDPSPESTAEVLAAYLEDTLDATSIPPSERGVCIIAAMAEAIDAATVNKDQAQHNDRPDRERDFKRLKDAWHTDADLRELLHSLANMVSK